MQESGGKKDENDQNQETKIHLDFIIKDLGYTWGIQTQI